MTAREVTRIAVARSTKRRPESRRGGTHGPPWNDRARGDHHPDSDYDFMVVIDAAGAADAREVALRHTMSDFEADRDGEVLYDAGTPNPPGRVRERPAVPESLAEWIARAEGDHEMMVRALRDSPVTDAAAFHAHRCAEKYLKAALIILGVQSPRTHMLRTVLALTEPHHQEDDLWPRTRNPQSSRPSVEEAQRAAEAARIIRSAIRSSVIH